MTGSDWRSVVNADVNFKLLTVGDIMTSPNLLRNPFHPIGNNYSLFSVTEALAREDSLRRIAVIDKSRRISQLVTCSAVIGYYHAHIADMGNKRYLPISYFRNFGKPGGIVSVKESDLAAEAFALLSKYKINSVAVVNEDGVLMSQLEVKDIKGIMPEGSPLFYSLPETVKSYLEALNLQNSGVAILPKVTCAKPTDTLEYCICSLGVVPFGPHQLYVCDEMMKPIGIVSMKDVLLEIIS